MLAEKIKNAATLGAVLLVVAGIIYVALGIGSDTTAYTYRGLTLVGFAVACAVVRGLINDTTTER